MKLKHHLIPLYQWAATQFSRKTVPLSPSMPNAVILLGPDYGNIGDLAIGYAQESFLKDISSEINVVSVPLAETYRVLRALRRDLGPRDVVFTVGGGSLGDLYPRADFGRQFLVSYLKNAPIVSFPQSITYSETPHGQERLRRTSKSFAKNKQFVLCARDEISEGLMSASFENEVLVAPDIVTSMLKQSREVKKIARNQLLVMLRDDAETELTPIQREQIVTRASEGFSKVEIQDNTVEDDRLRASSPESHVFKMLDAFRRSRVVVTDRLHGMIFAAITGTPCIVFANSNHKIRGMYDRWIRQCDYVVFVETYSPESLNSALSKLELVETDSNFDAIEFDFTSLTAYVENLFGIHPQSSGGINADMH